MTISTVNRSVTLVPLDKKEKTMPLAALLIQRLIAKNYSKYSSRESKSLRESGFKRYPRVTTKETIQSLLD